MADVEKTGNVADEGHDEVFEFEHQEPKNNLIALLLIVSCVVLVVTVVFAQWFYDLTRDVKAGQLQNLKFEQVETLRADEDKKLTGYRYADKEKTVVQIPVERAMQLIAEEAKSGQPKYAAEIKSVPVLVPGGAAAPTGSASPAASPAMPIPLPAKATDAGGAH